MFTEDMPSYFIYNSKKLKTTQKIPPVHWIQKLHIGKMKYYNANKLTVATAAKLMNFTNVIMNG